MSTSIAFAEKQECYHSGFHYDRQEPTCVKAGNIEFWTCCKCHEIMTTRPLSSQGQWTDKILDSELMPDHIAFLPSGDQHTYIPSTSCIGYCACRDCDEIGTQIMNNDDIALSSINSYGMNGSYVASQENDSEAITKGYTSSGAIAYNATDSEVFLLPKVNYSLYSFVSFDMSVYDASDPSFRK